MRKIQQGFTLIELMIVVAIIGILAAVAIPNYQTYTKKAKFTEVVQATAPFKIAVEGCYQDKQNLGSCSTAGTNGIPSAAGASGFVKSVSVGAGGVITAVGNAGTPVSGITFTLTPTSVAGTGGANLTWAKGGTCTSAAIC
ncbi:MAG: prepilin-type N-terminal cleavage/methylation domain-containing protein [Rhodocyclaceae bacterium]|nr:prepilin-type N-terminal cleavage/methylation domain-containing protein [Rhodocyclaceae bacterium]